MLIQELVYDSWADNCYEHEVVGDYWILKIYMGEAVEFTYLNIIYRLIALTTRRSNSTKMRGALTNNIYSIYRISCICDTAYRISTIVSKELYGIDKKRK